MSGKEDLENLLRSKERIEKRISRFESELKHLRAILALVEKEIGARSFKVAETLQPKPKPSVPPVEMPTVQMPTLPLKATDGTLLGTLYVGENEMRLVPSETVKFSVNTPPFNQFLIAKVLSGMVAKDRSDAMEGTITPDEILTYRVIQDGDLLREVTVRNYRDDRRATTLKNSIRWTLQKMYEKMKL